MIKVLFLFVLGLGPAYAAEVPGKVDLPIVPASPSAYFFNIDLDPRYQFVGTGALTEEDAARANCYRLVYNTEGRLREIQYRRAGVPMPDPFLGVASVEFEYQPGLERRWFRDAHDQAARDLDGIQGEELTLNRAGFPIAVTNLDASGGHIHDNSGVIRYVRTLDEHNRLITGRRLGLFGAAITDDYGFFETRTVYDLQGHPMERGNYDASGKPLNNDEGIALIRTIYTIFPDSTQLTESYFDASGVAAAEKSTGVHQRQQTTDQRGFLIDESYFDTTGAPILTADGGMHERRYQYDAKGNKTSEAFFDADGKLSNQKSPDFAKIVYKYDDKNRVVETAYFGDDGAPQVPPRLGYAVLRLGYDKNGSIVRQQFFDGQGNPSPQAQYGVPAIRIKVEDDTTLVMLRDGQDRPTKNPVSGYYAFSYKTAKDHPLSLTNDYFDRRGRPMSLLRVRIINPHLHLLETTPVMAWSAYLGTAATGIGSVLACWLAVRKSAHTKQRKVYVPTPSERFLGWLSVLFILEGSLRFFMTVYWTWIVYENGRMGDGFYILEAIIVLFFLYRLYRLRLTMRILNIGRDDLHGLVRNFFAKVNLKPEWIEASRSYVTPPLDIRVNFFRQKCHAYLAFRSRGAEGRKLARDAAQYLRAQAGGIQAPVRSRAIAFYYPSVAFCYLLLAGTAFYTLYQVIKGY